MLLLIGAIFGLGLIIYFAYSIFAKVQNPETDVTIPLRVLEEGTTVTNTSQMSPAASAVTSALAVSLALLIVGFIAILYNRSIQKFIAALAGKLHIPIFTTELICTFIIWTIATTILFFIFPLASIFALLAFVVNELLFIFAWGAYGQPVYKL